MKRIGDVLQNIPVRPPSTSSSIVISNRESVKCPICNDAGYLRGDFPVGHPMFGRITPCICKQRDIDERQADELHKLSNLDKFSQYTFDEFDATVSGVEEAYEAAYAFAVEPGHRWLFLYGPCGTGKTHLAVSIARYAIEQHQMSAYFAVVPDLLDHLRETFDPSSGTAYDDRFTMIRNAQVLILDDLGTENATPWAREKLYQIINHRYIEQLPTVITSNVDLKKVDDRIISRILDHRLSTYVEMDAEDYRRPGLPRTLRRTSRRT